MKKRADFRWQELEMASPYSAELPSSP